MTASTKPPPLGPEAARAADVLRARLGGAPLDWAIVSGSNFSAAFVGEQAAIGLQVEGRVSFAELELPLPSVAGHRGELVWGRVGARRVCVQTGRIHPYEGHPVQLSVAPLAAMLACGARGVVLTFAVGGLDPRLGVGQTVMLRDQIGLLGPTPLVGPWFVPCGRMYSPHLRRRLQAIHPGLGSVSLPEAVYIHARGPQYETPAETEALRRLGGDVVGMSTTYEAVLATAHGAALVGLGVVTNAAGQLDLSHEEVQQRSEEGRGEVASLLAQLLPDDPWE
jgi:purine-nucleoside phosphorylase